jgi:hypothetical protein
MIKFSGCKGIGEKIVIIKSQGKEKRKKEEIEREQQQQCDGPHSRNNKEKAQPTSGPSLSFPFSFLSFSLLPLCGWALGQTNRKEERECGSLCCCVE